MNEIKRLPDTDPLPGNRHESAVPVDVAFQHEETRTRATRN